MKIERKRDDFSRAQEVRLNACCCCCCCLIWPGGLIGALVGANMVAESWNVAYHDKNRHDGLVLARAWFWGSVLILALVNGIFGVLATLNIEFFEQSAIFMAIAAPVLHFMIAAIITSIAIRSRIPDYDTQTIIRKRLIAVVVGAFIGYGIGWALIPVFMS